MVSRKRRLIAILPAYEIAVSCIISIVAKFGHSSEYFHVNSSVSHYSNLALHVHSLRLPCIPTTNHTFTLRKFILHVSNTWRRPHSTTFHPNPLPMHLQMLIGSMCIQSGWVFLVCSADTINADWMRIRCASNGQCGQALMHFYIPTSLWCTTL